MRTNVGLSRREFIRRSSLIAGFAFAKESYFRNSEAFASELRKVESISTDRVRISSFDIDATPPVGSYLAYGKMVGKWDLSLRAKGFVIVGAGDPIVVCSIDWIGIGNSSYDFFKESLANAVGTTSDRVTIHTIHQHDSVICDFDAEKILINANVEPQCYDGTFARIFIKNLSQAAHDSLNTLHEVTHIGIGKANVYKIASNRRILSPNGEIRERWSACKDTTLISAPEGKIDPELSLISFWSGDDPIVITSYYATHPQSYYRTGIANPDFPGIARFMRQLSIPDALHIHFNGAGGNITAGKYNDGSHTNRMILANRLADGMKRAWENTTKYSISVKDIQWTVEKFVFPPAKYLENLVEKLKKDSSLYLQDRDNAQRQAWSDRCKAGKEMSISCLCLGKARILYLPSEAFIEYQLAAKAERPDLFVAVAAYGDYAPGYICSINAFKEGGYEASESATNIAPESARILLNSIHSILSIK
jgi:hypothetical protein